jgi:hypothetical protein
VSENPTEISPENGTRDSAELPAGSPSQPLSEHPGESAAEHVAPKRRPRVGRVAAVCGAVLLVAAVVSGVGYTVVTVDGAGRDPGKPTWRFPDVVKDKKEKAKPATSLVGMLLPYDDDYTRGPDLAEFGSDAELSGRQAAALRKETLTDLPRTQRQRLEKRIDDEHIKGMVMRSYVRSGPYGVYEESSFAVSVTLSQMANQRVVRELSTAQNSVFDAIGVFRKGPKIEGHKDAKCFLPPKNSDEKLDMMICSAYEGDVLVSATVSGVKPLDGRAVARFLAAQLDRITEPGEPV